MRNRAFFYPEAVNPLFRINILSLEPGELRTFPKPPKDSVGAFYLKGVITPADGVSGPEIEKHPEWRDPKDWGISNVNHQVDEITYRADPTDGAEWVCASGGVEATRLSVAGKAVIPAGHFAFVAQGKVHAGKDETEKAQREPRVIDKGDTVTELVRLVPISGGQAGEGELFAPFEKDTAVNGNGELILIAP
jgi:hypothetical protein